MRDRVEARFLHRRDTLFEDVDPDAGRRGLGDVAVEPTGVVEPFAIVGDAPDVQHVLAGASAAEELDAVVDVGHPRGLENPSPMGECSGVVRIDGDPAPVVP